MSREYQLKPSDTHTPQINYEAELNAEQYRAVSSKPGPMLVIAGAGSGKTRTLTYRVAYLVEHGVSPENILLLTFTNKAAKEMMRRVEDLVPHDFSRMWGGTFHHVGHRILRRNGDRIGLKKNFTIFDQEDSKDLIKACLADGSFKTREVKYPKAEVIQSIISMSANTQCEIKDIIDAQYPYFLELADDIHSLGELYQERKRASNAVDYDDLLILSLRLLQQDEELLDRYQNRFRHILVDEYQDTNVIQAELVDILADAHHRLMVVGDDAQSIYSWRGANFENIIDFPERHAGTEVVKIETNYRSTPEILALANESISNNTRQFPKELKAFKPSAEKPARVSVHESRQQAKFIAQRVLELHDGGQDLAEIAVLYRSHFHSMELQMELTKRKIPFRITSGLPFFQQAHVKDVSAFLRFAVNQEDEISFKRVALMLPGVGASTAHRMWHGVSSHEPWAEIKVPSKCQVVWDQWGETHRQLVDQLENTSPDQLIQQVMDAVYEEFLKAKFPNYVSRLDDLRQLQSFAESFPNMEEFLGQLSLMSNLDHQADAAGDEEEDKLILSSIHQAKGLEWKSVFVLMLCDGMFPSSRSLESDEGEEEERRLFYVAVTRAQDELYLVYPQVNTTRGGYGDVWQQPSRFLEEIPAAFYESWKISEESAWDDF